MTEKDKQLIEAARHMDWEKINEDEAETKEGWSELHHIRMNKYHADEYSAGML